MNIFMILSDELRADTLGFMGNDKIKTPNLDQLAEESLVFDKAYCNTSMCVPSRNTIATGRYAHSHGAVDNMLSPYEDEVTFYHLLKDEGYITTNHGKWHCNINPLDYGMTSSYGPGKDLSAPEKYITCFGIVDRELRKMTEHKRNNGEIPLIISGKRPVPMDETMDSVVTLKYLEDLDSVLDRGKPVMARLSIMDPHTPYIPAEPFASMYKAEDMDMPESLFEDLSNKPVLHNYFRKVRGYEPLEEMDYRKTKASYYGSVSHVDERVGKVIKKLKAKGVYDDSLILFVADHGSMMGEHGFIEKWGHSYEEVMHIPLMIKMPKGQLAGKHLDSFVETVDIMPTILDILGLEIPKRVQGKSLLPYMKGQVDQHKDQVFGQYYCGSLQNQASLVVRSDKWKLTTYPEGNKLEKFLPHDHPLRCSELFDKDYPLGELYDLEADPKEMNNLFDDPTYESIKKEYIGKINAWMDSLDRVADTDTIDENGAISIHVLKQGENMIKLSNEYKENGTWAKLAIKRR